VTDAAVVLDASALIAFLRNETGAEKVQPILNRCCISAVNLSESYSKMVEYGKAMEDVAHQVERLDIPVIEFDEEQARIAASIWKITRDVGMSLGDRCCLALALKLGLPAYTTDSEWEESPVGAKVVLIRPPKKR
jgi:ribonuclease VapC